MTLSDDATLTFVLQSGVSGRVKSGRIERVGESTINVYDRYGTLQPYFSGIRLRSWCIAGADGHPIPSWSAILPEDGERLRPSVKPAK
jgi:hypothetical protein